MTAPPDGAVTAPVDTAVGATRQAAAGGGTDPAQTDVASPTPTDGASTQAARRARHGPRPAAVWTGRALVAVALAGGWELLGRSHTDLSASIPTFSATCGELVRVLGDPALWLAMGRTLRSTVVGLGLCLLIGVPVGALIAVHRYAISSTRFLIDFCRTVPPLAIVPLFLLLWGPTPKMEVLLVLAVGVWPVLLQTLYGISGVDPELLRTARSFRLPAWRRAVFVVGPATMPYLATGVRICATLSLLLAIGSELIAGVPGLGQEILLSQQAGDAPRMFAQIIVTGALGTVLSIAISVAERRLLAWHHRPRAQQ